MSSSNVVDAKLITISVPVFNEEENIPRLIDRLQSFASTEKKYNFEFLFTDNDSTDRTFELLAEYSESDNRIRVLKFSRNYGFQKSILTNFLYARGDAAVQIDADLQDPPEIISKFLDDWEKGYKVVFGVRKHRPESKLINSARKLFYRCLTWLSETYVPPDAGDFRLIDRVIIEHLRAIQEQTPYLRGIIAGLGYSQKGIPYDRDARQFGVSKFSLFNLIELGLDGITSQSTKPLRIITLFGFGVCITTFAAAFIYLLLYFFGDAEPSHGFTTLVILVLASIGLNSFFLGLLGEYVGRVFNNSRGLPLSIVEMKIDHNINEIDINDSEGNSFETVSSDFKNEARHK